MHNSTIFCARNLIRTVCGPGWAEGSGEAIDSYGVAVAVPAEGLRSAQWMDWCVEGGQ
jgi:hypothetical protein